MENNKSTDIQNFIEEAFKRLIESKKLKLNDIGYLYTYGVTTGLIMLSEILKTIEQKGLKSASKIYNSRYLEMIHISISSEYHYRTSHFYQNGHGMKIPIELQEAFINLKTALNDIELEMTYEFKKLDKTLNQKELSYLFSALANKNYFRSNPSLLAESLNLLTGYSKNAIIRVIQTFNNTKGGLSEAEKQNLLKKIKDAIDSF